MPLDHVTRHGRW